jgi:hypothetical protein
LFHQFFRILLVDGKADAVYGSRCQVAGERRVLYFWHALANQVLTTLGNMASNLNLTDMEMCYKAFRTGLGSGGESRPRARSLTA